MTREYRETVAKPSNTGGESSNKSVALQNPNGRPTTTASAHNLLGGKGGEAGIKGGEGLGSQQTASLVCTYGRIWKRFLPIWRR